MHGRLKVRTDAEKALAEKKKNEEKAAKFRAGIESAFEMVSEPLETFSSKLIECIYWIF